MREPALGDPGCGRKPEGREGWADTTVGDRVGLQRPPALRSCCNSRQPASERVPLNFEGFGGVGP